MYTDEDLALIDMLQTAMLEFQQFAAWYQKEKGVSFETTVMLASGDGYTFCSTLKPEVLSPVLQRMLERLNAHEAPACQVIRPLVN